MARSLSESKLGKAITYALNQWPYLSRYLDSGLARIFHKHAPALTCPLPL